MSEPFSPVGALETLMIMAESTFGQKPGTFNGNAIGQAFNSFPATIGIQTVARSPRGSLTMPVPAPGGRSLATSLDVETTADTIAQILAYGLGKQTITNSSKFYSGTLQSGGSIGDTTMKVTANSLFGPPLIFPGQTLTVDTSSNSETVTVTTVNWSASGVPGAGWMVVGFSPAFTKTHASGVTVIGAAGTPLNLITPGSPLPTFTAQTNRPGGIATNKTGCKIDSLALSFKPKSGLTCKASIVMQDEEIEASPATASLSAKNPYVFEQLFVPPTFCGKALSNGSNSSLRSFDVSVNNNLIKDNFVGGAGNKVYSFPEQLRSVSGSITLGFETSNEFTQFQTNAAGGAFSYTSLAIPVQGIDPISGGNGNYFLLIYFPKVAITKWGATDDTGKEITQSLALSMGESSPGANDAIQIFAPQAGTASF